MAEKLIKVLIVDDEVLGRALIRELLKTDDEISIIGEADCGSDARAIIASDQPDIVFLDIQMPETNGLLLLEQLAASAVRMPLIIFTTAYADYAVRAFEFHALDYLLKPFDANRFRQSIERAKEHLKLSPFQSQASEQVGELLRHLREKPKFPERLLIKSNGRIVFVQTGEINWLKADDKYVHVRAGKVSHMIRQTLGGLKANLNPATFVQINRSVVINIEQIKELQPLFNGDYTILLRDEAEFILSRNFKDTVFALLGKPL